MKICTKCGEEKDELLFSFNKKRGNYYSRCKKCIAENKRNYREKNRDIILKQRREKRKVNNKVILQKEKDYRVKSSAKRNEYIKTYKKINEEILYQKRQEYYKKTKEKRKVYQQQYYIDNKEKLNSNNRKYYTNNKEKIIKHGIVYSNKRKEYDLNFKLKNILRNRLYYAIKNQYGKKADHLIALLGCSIQEVRVHLESQFSEGMSWENYGLYGWHIDHIIPCSSFDFTDPDQQKKCFHYTNLQPLWAEENLKKSNKIIEKTDN